ncbi:hypothetical protein ACRRTK_003900 [Alexandromys fortis]
MTILSSYIFIIVNILHIQSTGGRRKAFSTCSSHILAVALFYGSTAFMYLQPSSISSLGQKCYMLAVMAYDRYVAISNPLLYNVTMSYQVCLWMIAGVYGMGFISATADAISIMRLLFSVTILSSYIFIVVSILNIHSTGGRLKAFSTCSSHILAVAIFYGSLSFMYLQPPSHSSLGQKLSCSSTFINEVLAWSLGSITILVPAVTILSSYIFIVVSILNIHSTGGRLKAFSTCSSHILAVAIFYGSLAFMYLQPPSHSSLGQKCHMLGVMAYDRYVAISKPLLYNVTMSYQVCLWMIAGVYGMGFISTTVLAFFMIRLVFCKANIIRHYFCDFFPLLELSCSSTFVNEVIVLFLSSFNILIPVVTILSSYIFILVSILNIQSSGGRRKAFSTCSSHILAVAIFFGSLAFMYLQPSSVNSLDQSKLSSVFYTIIVPMLNPMIYSLKNKDVKISLRKLIQKLSFHSTKNDFH